MTREQRAAQRFTRNQQIIRAQELLRSLKQSANGGVRDTAFRKMRTSTEILSAALEMLRDVMTTEELAYMLIGTALMELVLETPLDDVDAELAKALGVVAHEQ